MNGKVELIREKLQEAQAVVIGAGAGLSTAAGLTYGGERFRRYFGDFIRKYGMTDMYSAGFYPFETQEEKWAYWSRHIYYNRYDQPAGNAYLNLCRLVRDKEYFVLTTNVDHQFWLAGFDDRRIFATQGDYGLFQCKQACHKKLYGNEAADPGHGEAEQKDCRIPSGSRCPSVRCAEAIWKYICGATVILWRMRRGTGQRYGMKHFWAITRKKDWFSWN